MKTGKRSVILALAVVAVALLGFTGCSTTGKGSKDGAGDGLSEADLAAQREGRFGSGGIPTAEGEGIFRDVNFDYDSALINDSARQNLEYNAEILRQQPNLKIQLEGHCDERGTAEYNLALGADRARAVKEALLSQGLPANRFETISYGEEVPLDPTADESAYSRNRRVHFSALGAGGHAAALEQGSRDRF